MIGAIFVKFSQLILMKIITIIATRCQIVRLKCTKFYSGSLQCSPDPLAGIKGPTSKGRGEEGKEVWSEERASLYFFLQIYAHVTWCLIRSY